MGCWLVRPPMRQAAQAADSCRLVGPPLRKAANEQIMGFHCVGPTRAYLEATFANRPILEKQNGLQSSLFRG